MIHNHRLVIHFNLTLKILFLMSNNTFIIKTINDTD